jgi:hypothetical protein
MQMYRVGATKVQCERSPLMYEFFFRVASNMFNALRKK